MTQVAKPAKPLKALKPDSASSETKAKLKALAQIIPEIPEEPSGVLEATLEPKPSGAPETPKGSDVIIVGPQEATGLLVFLITRLLDIILSRMNKVLLTAKEKSLLEEPCNEIEVKYLSPVVRGYMEKTSPFAKLAFEIALIIQSRSKEGIPSGAPETTPTPA